MPYVLGPAAVALGLLGYARPQGKGAAVVAIVLGSLATVAAVAAVIIDQSSSPSAGEQPEPHLDAVRVGGGFAVVVHVRCDAGRVAETGGDEQRPEARGTVSGLDDLRKSAASASDERGRRGDLLGGLGGGGLGSVLGGILGGGGGGRSGGLGGGNPMLRMLLPLVAGLLMNGGLQKILGRLQQGGKGAKAAVVGLDGRERAGRRRRHPRGARRSRSSSSIAQQLGVSEDEAAEAVAQVLPDVVDQTTPEGELPAEETLNERLGASARARRRQRLEQASG